MASPPKTTNPDSIPEDTAPRQFTRTVSQGSSEGDDGEKKPARKISTGMDTRWRTASFSEPGRIVVVAVDSSDTAKVSFEWYLDNVHRGDDLIVLVHCPEAPRLPTFSFRSGAKPPVQEWKSIMDEMNANTARLEADYEGTLIQKKLRYKVRGESMKNPGEGICRIAAEEKANLVVIGTRGLSTVRRAVLGSVSDFVVRNAGIPTLIVPSNKK